MNEHLIIQTRFWTFILKIDRSIRFSLVHNYTSLRTIGYYYTYNNVIGAYIAFKYTTTKYSRHLSNSTACMYVTLVIFLSARFFKQNRQIDRRSISEWYILVTRRTIYPPSSKSMCLPCEITLHFGIIVKYAIRTFSPRLLPNGI